MALAALLLMLLMETSATHSRERRSTVPAVVAVRFRVCNGESGDWRDSVLNVT